MVIQDPPRGVENQVKPEHALNIYLEHHSGEVTHEKLQSDEFLLNHFLRWCAPIILRDEFYDRLEITTTSLIRREVSHQPIGECHSKNGKSPSESDSVIEIAQIQLTNRSDVGGMLRRELLVSAGAAATGYRFSRQGQDSDGEVGDAKIPNQRWTRSYDDLGEGQGIQMWQVVPARDDGYLVMGSNARKSPTGHHRWTILRKMDSEGNLGWKQSFEDKLDKTKVEQSVPASDQVHQRDDGVENEIKDIIPAHDDGYVFCGYADWSQEISNPRHWLGKIDTEGNIQWESEFRTGLWGDIFWSVTQAPDGGYVAVGERAKDDKTSRRGAIVKTDGSGAVQFTKEFENTGGKYDVYGEAFTDVVPAHDGGYVAAAQKRTVKVSSEGSLEWEVPTRPITANLLRLPSQGYLVVGDDINAGNVIRITRITTDGSKSFDKGVPFDVNSIETPQTDTLALVNDREFVFGGRVYAGNGDQLWLAKFSIDGELKWERRLQNGRITQVAADDDSYVVSGGLIRDFVTFDAVPYVATADSPAEPTGSSKTGTSAGSSLAGSEAPANSTSSASGDGFGVLGSVAALGTLAGAGISAVKRRNRSN